MAAIMMMKKLSLSFPAISADRLNIRQIWVKNLLLFQYIERLHLEGLFLVRCCVIPASCDIEWEKFE